MTNSTMELLLLSNVYVCTFWGDRNRYSLHVKMDQCVEAMILFLGVGEYCVSVHMSIIWFPSNGPCISNSTLPYALQDSSRGHTHMYGWGHLPSSWY